MSEESANTSALPRPTLLRLGAAGGDAAALAAAQTWAAPLLAQRGLLSPDGAFAATSTALSDGLFYIEQFPTSRVIISAFIVPLPILKALGPVPKSVYFAWPNPPGPGPGQQ